MCTDKKKIHNCNNTLLKQDFGSGGFGGGGGFGGNEVFGETSVVTTPSSISSAIPTFAITTFSDISTATATATTEKNCLKVLCFYFIF